MGRLVWLLWLVAGDAFAAQVKLATEDGKTVYAESYGTGARGVLLIHDKGGAAADWANFAGRLAENGFQVLAVDLRGHGKSKAAADPLADADFPAMVAELDAGTAWLRSHGATSVNAVGAGLGANLALTAASGSQGPDAIVLLTPQLNASGVKLSGPLATYNRAMLVVADQGDATAVRTAQLIGSKALFPAQLELVAAGASGHRMLNTVPALEPLLVGWLNGARGPDGAVARPEQRLGQEDVGGIETSGTRYEDRQ